MPAGRPPIVSLDEPQPEKVPAALIHGACRLDQRYRVFDDDRRVEEAKLICRDCPVSGLCLAYALNNEPYGVWGGTTGKEREHLRGGGAVVDPWRRQLAIEFRADLNGPTMAENIARKWGMNVRTVERNRARLRGLRDVA